MGFFIFRNKWITILVIPILIGIIVTATGRIISNQYAEKKSITYKKLFWGNLIKVDSIIKEKIKIQYDNKIIKNIAFYKVYFVNDGNKPIIDYPISFEVSKGIILLLPQIIASPENLETKSVSKNTRLNTKEYIIPLMNQKDNIEFTFYGLIQDEDADTTYIKVTGGHMPGVGFREFVEPTSDTYKSYIKYYLILLGILLLIIFIRRKKSRNVDERTVSSHV